MIAADEIMARAAERTGLDDFGPDTYREGLELWVDAAERAPVQRSEAVDEAVDYVVHLLVNRLKVIDQLARHPEVCETSVDRPLIVMGMPRSGTTLLSYLLRQDPCRRSLLL